MSSYQIDLARDIYLEMNPCAEELPNGVISVCGKTYHSLDAGWIDCGSYFLNTHNQGTDGWHSARRQGLKLLDGTDSPISLVPRLVTGSNYGKAAGISPYETQESYMTKWALNIEEKFSVVAQGHLQRGTKFEPVARLMYEDVKHVIVREVGLAIPKWDLSIGSSVDGLVGEDGMIEIKCPEYVYDGYINYQKKNVNPALYVKKDHLAQMQGGMAILNRQWCDYVVYGVKEGVLFIQRIEFDKVWWNSFLYPKLREFVVEAQSLRELVSKDEELQNTLSKVQVGIIPFEFLLLEIQSKK